MKLFKKLNFNKLLFYISKIKIYLLPDFRKKNFQFSLYNVKLFKINQKNIFFLVNFILLVIFKNSNVFVYLSEFSGINIRFFSIKILLTSKNKFELINKILIFLFQKLEFFTHNSIVLHIYNGLAYIKLFINFIKLKFILIFTKLFILIPFNGCRKNK